MGEGAGIKLAEIDTHNNSIPSFTVCHHKFDYESNHFRWFDIKTFDNEVEMTQLMNQIFDDIERRRVLGEADIKEQVAGRFNKPNTI
jgi:hypothetical protein